MVSLGLTKLWWIRAAADHHGGNDFYFGASLVLGSALELLFSPITELVTVSCLIKSAFIIHHNPSEKRFVVIEEIKRM